MTSPNSLVLPNFAITVRHGAISAAFTSRGLTSFDAAVRHVGSLPYGRTVDRSNYLLVLSEGRGACSGKHALLAALARELELEIELMVGIYEMSQENTPGVGVILERAGLKSIPEAHCYLRYHGRRFDVTRGSAPQTPLVDFLAESVIQPEDIGVLKVKLHREFLAAWIANDSRYDIEDIWKVRENCIEALSEQVPR